MSRALENAPTDKRYSKNGIQSSSRPQMGHVIRILVWSRYYDGMKQIINIFLLVWLPMNFDRMIAMATWMETHAIALSVNYNYVWHQVRRKYEATCLWRWWCIRSFVTLRNHNATVWVQNHSFGNRQQCYIDETACRASKRSNYSNLSECQFQSSVNWRAYETYESE